MITETDTFPRLCDYNSWVNFLDAFEKGDGDADYITVMSAGTCPEYSGIKQYFHQRVEHAVNSIVNGCIAELKRNMMRVAENNEITALHMVFNRFAKKVEKCLFFCYIPFLESDFKAALLHATKMEVYRFWNQLLRSLKDSARSSTNTCLEEEIFLIERIRLFPGSDVFGDSDE